jgi:WD40 repeat protein/serine/threonine protein kinase
MENLCGTHIKGYELQERIGSGGFGAVYKANQTTVGREVAIKIILPGFANRPDFIRRFETEAQLIARLEHPFIVPLFDYWRDPNGAYLVMRWLRGGSLKEGLQQGAFDIDAAATLMEQITGALSAAHRHGVIHRDLKPGNILLDEDSNAYLADFGIAKDISLTGTGEVTEPDQIIGSPDYLAPEQARSEPVTPHTDIYSLGVVLYEMLTGQHPFPNITGVERLFKHLNEPLPLIDGLDPACQDALNDVIQTATQKDPAHRFDDVLEMTAAFRKAIAARQAPSESELVELLTLREQEILQGIIDGLSNNQIAERLFVELSTVKWYIKQIYKKLGVRSRVQAIVRARELDLIVPGPGNGHPTIIGGTTSITHLPAPENPYKGLRAFQPADELDFFGREKLTKKIIQRLSEKNEMTRFLAIVGPSGSGKSSLVNAGLIPALWRGELPGSERWFVVAMLPGSHPLDELEVVLTRVAADQSGNLNEQLRRDERGLVRASQLILPNDGSELVLIVDQFEEAFTLTENETERQKFLDLLHTAVTEKRSRVRIVVTLRADFYDRPLMYPQFGEMVRTRMETVLPLSAKELESAIVNPAQRVGVTFEEGLVATIISEVNYQPGGLPLLQYALTELFEQRDNRLLTHEAYQTIGGTVGALAQRAEELYNELNVDGQETAKQMFLRLVTLGEGVEDTRRRTPRAELTAITANEDLLNDIIDLFAEYRLLSLDHDPATRTPTVEVAHEAMLREWERLRNWLNESRSDVRMQRQLAQMADEWRASNQDSSFLLRGSRLEMFEGWMASTTLAIAPQERDFLETSLAERAHRDAEQRNQKAREASLEQRARRILQGLVVVFLIAAVVSGGLALWANNQRQEADLAREAESAARHDALQQASIGLAAQAQLELEQGLPERGVLLALEALEEYPYTWQAERALFAAVTQNRLARVLKGHTAWVNFVAWSPDGTRLLTTSDDGTARVWDTQTGAELLVLSEYTAEVAEGKWSSDGLQIAIASLDGTANVWDASTGDVILTLVHPAPVLSIAWSPDRTRIAIACLDNTAVIWDAQTGGQLAVLSAHTGPLERADWSPDGTRLATTGKDGTTRIWDATTFEELYTLDGAMHLFGTSTMWSPDGTRLVTASVDGSAALIWDANTGTELFTLPAEQPRTVYAAIWSPDGSRLLVVTLGNQQVDGVVSIWDTSTGEKLFRLQKPGVGGWLRSAWSPDGTRVAVNQEMGETTIWDVVNGQEAFTLRHPSIPWGIDWSPDGKLVAIGYDTGEVLLWDATDLALLSLPAQDPRIRGWSPDSQYLLRADWGGPLIIADGVTGAEVMTIPTTELYWASWSPDGKWIGTGHIDGSARIWNAASGDKVLLVEIGEETEVSGPFWSPDSQQFSLTANGTAYVFDLSGERLHTLGNPEEGFMGPAIWSPDGTRIAAGRGAGVGVRNGLVEIWDAVTGEALLTVPTDGFVLGLDWSPNGTQLVVPSASGLVRIIDAQTGDTLLTYAGHLANVSVAQWSPDGTRIMSLGNNGLRIWDPITGNDYGVLELRNWACLWSPDGTRILSIGTDSVLRVWPAFLDTASLIAHAKECCVFGELTPRERESFGLPPREP